MFTSPNAVRITTEAAAHGFDDIGDLQGSGVVSTAAQAGGRWSGKTILTMSAAHNLKHGAAIVIAGTTSYNGPTRVLRVIDATSVVVNKAYVASEAGTWNALGGESAWSAFMPVGGDLLASYITTLTFYDDAAQGGQQNEQAYTMDRVYYFPGIIKQIQLSAGNVRLIRHSNLNPGGIDLS